MKPEQASFKCRLWMGRRHCFSLQLAAILSAKPPRACVHSEGLKNPQITTRSRAIDVQEPLSGIMNSCWGMFPSMFIMSNWHCVPLRTPVMNSLQDHHLRESQAFKRRGRKLHVTTVGCFQLEQITLILTPGHRAVRDGQRHAAALLFANRNIQKHALNGTCFYQFTNCDTSIRKRPWGRG